MKITRNAADMDSSTMPAESKTKRLMGTYRYNIVIKTQTGFVTTKYKSPEKLEVGEELLVFYGGENHLIRVTTISKGQKHNVEAEEI